jgi:drug/metabolite transporter (DMT)-like permease
VAAWGGVGYGGAILLQNAGVEHTSVGHAALLIGAVPALVAATAALSGRGAGGRGPWAGSVVALAGVGLVAGSGGTASPAGDGLMLVSALVQAAFLVAQTDLLDGRDPVAVTAVQMLAAALVALPAALLNGLPSVGATASATAAVGMLVVGGTLVPFALFAFGQARVRPQVAGAFVNLEPLVGAAVAILGFGDAFGPAQAVGGLAILAGIALGSAADGGAAPEAAEPARVAGFEAWQSTSSAPPRRSRPAPSAWARSRRSRSSHAHASSRRPAETSSTLRSANRTSTRRRTSPTPPSPQCAGARPITAQALA